MADMEIIVRLGNLPKASPVAKTENSLITSDYTSFQDMQQSSQGAAMAQTAMVAYPMGAVVADSLINYQINTVSLRTGNNEYEQRLQFGYSAAKKGIGMGAAALVGLATGNPMVIGGVIAMGISKALNISQRINTLQMEENLENVSIGMANVRAGTAGRRSPNQ